VATGDLPKPFLGLTQHIINWQELAVDAALSGDKDVLYQALLACPFVHDMNAAKSIMDELLEAHAEYMPQFKKKI
jgi:alpha-galactosidase/6-phospho-beta-glucosidase family protein